MNVDTWHIAREILNRRLAVADCSEVKRWSCAGRRGCQRRVEQNESSGCSAPAGIVKGSDMPQGTIKSVVLDRGFGFIARPGEADLFFHVKDVDRSLAWDEQLIERRVQFEIVSTDRGLQARNVLSM